MKVLLVEDEVDLLDLVAQALDHYGIDVTEASSGAIAIEKLRGPASFDILVSDIAMPGDVSGIDVAHEVSKAHPGMRVVLTSGHPLAHFPPLPKNAQFLPKPYRVKQLVDVLKSFGE